jgi:hypothetical protein
MNEVEDTRLKEFRQLKKEIRGSKDHLIVGIDVAKEKHHAFLGTATGKTLVRRLIFDSRFEAERPKPVWPWNLANRSCSQKADVEEFGSLLPMFNSFSYHAKS